jgi:hypothetical protein
VKHDDAQPQALLEGFTLEQWASYGRRKSGITSKVCKENGRLKAMLDSIGHDQDELITSNVGQRNACDDEDPLASNDPWSSRAGQCLGSEGMAQCKNTWAAPASDPWVNYVATGSVDGSVSDAIDATSTVGPLGLNANTSGTVPKESSRGLVLSEPVGKVFIWDDARDDDVDNVDIECRAPPARDELTVKNGMHSSRWDWRTTSAESWESIYVKFPHSFQMTCREYVKKKWPMSSRLKDAALHWQRCGGGAALPDRAHYMIVDEGLREEGRLLSRVFQDAWRCRAPEWGG